MYICVNEKENIFHSKKDKNLQEKKTQCANKSEDKNKIYKNV
jgi:hypothetical protein